MGRSVSYTHNKLFLKAIGTYFYIENIIAVGMII